MSPKCSIIRNTTASTTDPCTPSTVKAANTFTGEVWQERVHFDTENGLYVSQVTFLPNARTYWHTHEKGQVLEVKLGSGWVCDAGEKPQRIRTGDLVVCPAGTRHWHGADNGSMMMHMAVTLGKTTFDEEVSEEEYQQKSA
jgi:quercetin dioxygenase-like cupin family protein